MTFLQILWGTTPMGQQLPIIDKAFFIGINPPKNQGMESIKVIYGGGVPVSSSSVIKFFFFFSPSPPPLLRGKGV
jgi:hypothetical protein